MPQARAAASLEPRANSRRPNTVRLSTAATSSARASVVHTPGGTSIQARCGNVTKNSFTHVGGAFTVCSCASHFATPRAMPSMPSVAIKGTTRSLVTSIPFATPTMPPTSTAAATAAIGHPPPARTRAVTTPVSAIVAPTDRSIPPPTMIIVMPIAPVATMAVCERTMRRLNGER